MNQTYNLRAWAVIIFGTVLVAAMAILIAVTARTAEPKSNTVQIVAAENFWGSIAAQIGGTHVTVTSIITDPASDPHLYESSAKDAGVLSSAQLVIVNGLGYDEFMDKLLDASSSHTRMRLSAAEVTGISGSNANPHIWYDTAKVPLVAAAIEQHLEHLDSAHTADYRANLSKFNASLAPLNGALAAVKQKYSSAPVAYTERVPGYVLQNAGLRVVASDGFAAAVEEGNDPTPADATAMNSAITQHQIKVLLYNSQATSAVTQRVQDLARQNGIPVVGVTETIPDAKQTYQQWQLDQIKALLVALGG